MKHRFLFNYVVDFPFGRGKRFAGNAGSILNGFIGGWSAAGTTTYRSSSSFSLVCVSGFCRNYITIGQGKLSRPTFVDPRISSDNGVSDHAALEGSAGFTPYFNPGSFRPVVDMEIGGVGAALQDMRAPAFSKWDFALLGSESHYMQLRFEGQNIFNYMNAGKPINQLPDRAFGTITSQQGFRGRS